MRVPLAALLVALTAANFATGAEGPSAGRVDDAPARQFFAKHCQACHAGAKPKGDFRLDALSANFAEQPSREKWLAVLEQVKSGTMPPKGKPRPTGEEVQELVEWIT